MAARRSVVVEVGKRSKDKDPLGVEAGCQSHRFASTWLSLLLFGPRGVGQGRAPVSHRCSMGCQDESGVEICWQRGCSMRWDSNLSTQDILDIQEPGPIVRSALWSIPNGRQGSWCPYCMPLFLPITPSWVRKLSPNRNGREKKTTEQNNYHGELLSLHQG